MSLDKFKEQCCKKLTESFNDIGRDINGQLLASHDELSRSLSQAINSTHEQAITRFSSWIARVLEAEKLAINSERGKLRHLLEIRASLDTHQVEMAKLMTVAANQSQAMCK